MSSDFQADLDAIARIERGAHDPRRGVPHDGHGLRGRRARHRGTLDRLQREDDIDFGLVPGGELKVETTICHEIRQSGEPMVIDHVAQDAAYCGHPTPAMYGFQSYISVPIVRSTAPFSAPSAPSILGPPPQHARHGGHVQALRRISSPFTSTPSSGWSRARRRWPANASRLGCASNSSRCWATTCAIR